MIKKVKFHSIEELYKNIKTIDSKSLQLKKGPFFSYFTEYFYENKIVHNIYTNASILCEGTTQSKYYLFIISTSYNLQKFKGQEFDSNSIIVISPKEEFSKINFGTNNSLIMYMPKEEIEKKYGFLETGIYKIENTQESKEISQHTFNLLNSHESKEDLSFEENLNTSIKTLSNILLKKTISIDKKIKNNALNFYKIKSFMEKEYKNNLDIIEIAEHFNITDRTLRNLFNNQLGISPKQFQKALKMNYLKKSIIKNPNITISKIILNEGMSFQSHVIKDFKKYFNVTPNQFKKNYFQN